VLLGHVQLSLLLHTDCTLVSVFIIALFHPGQQLLEGLLDSDPIRLGGAPLDMLREGRSCVARHVCTARATCGFQGVSNTAASLYFISHTFLRPCCRVGIDKVGLREIRYRYYRRYLYRRI
jgi:hypothetical protein